MINIRVFLIFLVSCLAGVPLQAHADSSIMVSGSGLGDFSVMAMQMEDIVAMEIDISYDVSTLANPRVSPTGLLYQAQAKVVSNTARPGTIHISASGGQPIEGHGNIVILDFDLSSETSAGRITSASAHMTKSNGQSISVPVVIENPPSPEKVIADREQESSVDKTPDTSIQSAAPSEQLIRSENNQVRTGSRVTNSAKISPSQSDRADKGVNPQVSSAGPPAKRPNAEDCQFLLYKSPLTRIRESVGEINSKDLPAYFAIDPGCPIRQKPAVVLSDGKTRVTVVMELASQAEQAPNFALQGAHCISLMQRDSSWIMEVVPHAGVLEATVSAMYDDKIVQFPLTVAPPLDVYLKSRSASAELTSTDKYVYLVNDLVNGIKQ